MLLGVNNPGLYVEAFCNGLSNVAEKYHDEICKLEDTLLKDPHLSLTFFLTYIEKYEIIFSTLLTTIDTISKNNIYGCLILGELLNNFNSGSLVIAETTNL